jgi:urease accessory protein
LLQLADSAFPSGSFAHSSGLEALLQLGFVRDERALALRLRELCYSMAASALPFLAAAWRAVTAGDVVRAAAVDRRQEAFVSSHVANRASRAQGEAFLLAAGTAFHDARIHALRVQLPFRHSGTSVGAALALAEIQLADARALFLFTSVRAALSAAVRLGVVGPLRAQKLLVDLHPAIDEALARTAGSDVDDACSLSPLLDVAQAAQDRLYSRLFQS